MTEVSLRLATAADQHLPYYSHSIMEAIATCPKWGIIRYRHRKYYRSNYRAMALEAGSIMHDVFAAFRLWQLLRHQNLPEHFEFHGKRLFGSNRMFNAWEDQGGGENELFNFLFNILNSGDFYDDPDDKTRTLSNMEESIIYYVRHMLPTVGTNPVWVADEKDATALVGIEIPFDMVVNEELRMIGTIDGIAQKIGYIRPEENKTASRLDEAWRRAWEVKAQVTGYKLAAQLVTGQPAKDETRIIGIKLKQTRSHEDFLDFIEYRDEEAIVDWIRTLYFIHSTCLAYEQEPLSAPMFTHSCNRYFRPCGFVDLCAASPSDQEDIFESMEETPLSPSEQSIMDRYKDDPDAGLQEL